MARSDAPSLEYGLHNSMTALLSSLGTNPALNATIKFVERLVGGSTIQGEHIAESSSSTVYKLYSSR